MFISLVNILSHISSLLIIVVGAGVGVGVGVDGSARFFLSEIGDWVGIGGSSRRVRVGGCWIGIGGRGRGFVPPIKSLSAIYLDLYFKYLFW